MTIQKVLVGPIRTCCYLYSEDDSHLYIIDPGDDAQRILEAIDHTGLEPAGILITHAHFDHILASGYICRDYPEVSVYAHREESFRMGAEGRMYQARNIQAAVPQLAAHAEEGLKLLPEVTTVLQHLDTIPYTSLTVLHTPGHTEGSVGYYSRKENLLFAGDTLFFESVGRTDFPGGSRKELIHSIRSGLFALPDETTVYPGHGRETSIGHERRCNPFVGDTG